MCFAPISLNKVKKGNVMEYKILEKESFTIVGVGRRFNGETSYTEIPKFWDEYYESWAKKGMSGMFGACIDCNGNDFDYYIADLYLPWKEIPEGCKTVTFESGSWAVFPWKGECPEALQAVNTWVWSQWLPSVKDYEMRADYNLEVYLSDTEGEIWVPVRKSN